MDFDRKVYCTFDPLMGGTRMLVVLTSFANYSFHILCVGAKDVDMEMLFDRSNRLMK
jgi:hypothetical protein